MQISAAALNCLYRFIGGPLGVDLTLTIVRYATGFVTRSTIDVVDDEADLGSTSSLPPVPSVLRKRKMESVSETCCSSRFPDAKRPFSKESPSKCYPKSLSVLDMIKLGKIVDSCRTTVVRLYSFDIDLMTWSKVPKTVEFLIEEQPLGQGGFRSAYKATSQNVDFKNSCWVIKKYLPDAVATIEATNHTLEDHNKKVVQCICWPATLHFN